jgi:predicted amidohydrolase
LKRSVVSVVQYGIGPLKSKRAFWQNVGRFVDRAKARGAELIVFPEYVTAHLLALEPAMTNAEACEYLHGQTEDYIRHFSALSRERDITIVGGTHIHREGVPADSGTYYNESFLFHPDGRIDRQPKIHLTPEERKEWPLMPGDRYAVFDTRVGRVAIQVCYDIEFPEGSRILADMGAELICCPSYTDAAAGYWRVRNCGQARAIENQLIVAVSGIVGQMPGVAQIDTGYCRAGVFAPCDRPYPANGVLAEGASNRSGLVCAIVDLDVLHENRTGGAVSPYFDRKPELYNRYVKAFSAECNN